MVAWSWGGRAGEFITKPPAGDPALWAPLTFAGFQDFLGRMRFRSSEQNAICTKATLQNTWMWSPR
jgi:hypothetical protein